MATWATYRDDTLRFILGDKKAQGVTTRFSDAELLVLMNQAIRVISQRTGVAKSSTLAAGAYEYSLPTDCIDVLSVEVTDDHYFVTGIEIKPNVVLQDPSRNSKSQQLYIVNYPTTGKITLSWTPTGDLRLRYRAYFAALSGDQSNVDFAPYLWLELAAAFYVCYLAYVKEATRRSNLEQWATRPELATGNPPEEHAAFVLKQYDILMNTYGSVRYA